jgi:hypothetical protein
MSELEASVGLGLVAICVTPFDEQNQILFPSRASSTLWNNQNVILDENSFVVKRSFNHKEVEEWNGFKLAVTMWSKGSVNLTPLAEHINSAFQNTLIDYTIESYFRSSSWSSLTNLNRLPELSKKSSSAQKEVHCHQINNSLAIFPWIFETGSSRENPVIQNISIESNLPLDVIARETRHILHTDEIQAYFFSKQGENYILIEELPLEDDGVFENYIIVGSPDIFTPQTEIVRRMSNISDASSVGFHSPKVNSIKVTKSGSVDSVEIEKSKISLLGDFEEVFMFPDLFFPFFPIYGKRSSFFLLNLSPERVIASTYNWKKSESDRLFLKLIKVLNWVKINHQFNARKENYIKLKTQKCKEMRLEDIEEGPLGELFASRFRDLDFIYHIGGFDAFQLQSQIVNFLELFFRFGHKPVKSSPARDKELTDFQTALSLSEMSNVLQSITLIHSSSSPIFFSDCCLGLIKKWSQFDPDNFLDLTKTISSLQPGISPRRATKKGDWFEKMISSYLDSYQEYLQHLGMEIVQIDISSLENSGSLFINDEEYVETPSLFLRKVFPDRVILVQCGFYSYFATVNVLAFSYQASDTSNVSFTDDFAKECTAMKLYSHIVSFSYDFHLRYIQDLLFRPDSVDFPLEIIQILKVFCDLNPRKARWSRNRIFRGQFAEHKESADLFRYILIHPGIYGFEPILSNGRPVAFGITVDCPSPERTIKTASEFDYTLIVSEAENSEGLNSKYFDVEYFVLAVDKVNSFPHKKHSDIREVSVNVYEDPLMEYLADGYYLRDVVACFEKRIQNLVRMVFFAII